MYDLVEQALVNSEITTDLRDRYVDRREGLIALVHPMDRVPKTSLLTKFVPWLSELLAERNQEQEHPLRLRVAIHPGDVPYDEAGWFGEDIDIAIDLLDALVAKDRSRQAPPSLVVVVSDQIHRSVIKHGYDGIDARLFEPLIKLEVGGGQCVGWVHVPGESL
ncbi:hypothetical protein [Lentzea sp. NPDC060358]|uniref:hypothetical protein n=1 Tax=Lentzea sp. NPDC060358 TaxID=3347103 RepID=UPI0036604D9A